MKKTAVKVDFIIHPWELEVLNGVLQARDFIKIRDPDSKEVYYDHPKLGRFSLYNIERDFDNGFTTIILIPMNKIQSSSGRERLKELLSECTEAQHLMFKRMYAHETLDMDINDAVEQMDEIKVDWAIAQCERTVKRNRENV